MNCVKCLKVIIKEGKRICSESKWGTLGTIV